MNASNLDLRAPQQVKKKQRRRKEIKINERKERKKIVEQSRTKTKDEDCREH